MTAGNLAGKNVESALDLLEFEFEVLEVEVLELGALEALEVGL